MPDANASILDPDAAPTEAARWPATTPQPHLVLEGFSGPLDHLLALAQAQKVDLSAVSLTALVEQLAAALRQTPAVPLGQQAEWVVMAAWLLQLRSLLLLPVDLPIQQDATVEARQLRERLVALDAMQALAGWLTHQPELGRDVFSRGQPEVLGLSVEAEPVPDVIAFLWASLALFDDAPAADTRTIYQPVPLNLYAVGEARDRILQRLAQVTGEAALDQLLPDWEGQADPTAPSRLRRRSGWCSTLVASLELAKQGSLTLRQEEGFQTIQVAPASCATA